MDPHAQGWVPIECPHMRAGREWYGEPPGDYEVEMARVPGFTVANSFPQIPGCVNSGTSMLQWPNDLCIVLQSVYGFIICMYVCLSLHKTSPLPEAVPRHVGCVTSHMQCV